MPHFRRPTEEVDRRAQAILERRRVDELVQLVLVEAGGYPQARIELDAAALAEAERLDGRYCLVTNDRDLATDELFTAYKRQHLIERRFTNFKGPWPSARFSSTPTGGSPPSSP